MPDNNNNLQNEVDLHSLETQPERTEPDGDGPQGGQKEGYEGRRQGSGLREQKDRHSGRSKSDK